jgi:hypothetical protein
VPSQHPSPQSQIFTSWLFSGEQPHAPIKHVFGKSPACRQQRPVVTVPPEFMHCSSADTEIQPLIKTIPTIPNKAIKSFFIYLISLDGILKFLKDFCYSLRMALKWYEFYLKEVRGKVTGKQYYMAESKPLIRSFIMPTELYRQSEKGGKDPVTVFTLETRDYEPINAIAEGYLEEPDVGDIAEADIHHFPGPRCIIHGEREIYAKIFKMIERIEKVANW